VIPSLLSPEEEISEKKHFAYVCMQTENEKDNRPKLCSAQIRKCNLTDFHKLSIITLKEV
jgi:hypothetical protein